MSTLPDRPCFDHYRRQAKDLLKAAQSGVPTALALIREHNSKALSKGKLRLTDAQHALARRDGFASWSKLKSQVVAIETKQFFADVEACDVEAIQRRLAYLPELANAVNENGETPFHIAAGGNDVPLAELLLKAGADPNKRYGASAHNAMSWAITVGSFEFARELVRLGEKPDLFGAAGLGELEIVKSFWVDGRLSPGASTTGSSRFAADGSRLPRPPEIESEVISDAMVMACRSGQREAAEWLLAHGGDLTFRGYIGGTALHWAEYSGNDDLCIMLRTAGASDETLDEAYKATPRAFGVIVPASWGLAPRLGRVLDAHPDRLNLTGEVGSALNAAVAGGHVGTTRLLLDQGADRSLKNDAGQTPIDIARERGLSDLIALLGE